MPKFIVYGRLPALNDYSKAERSKSWQAGAKLKKTAQEQVEWAIRQQLKGVHMEACIINILWVEPNKKRDKDNIAFGKKFIFDALITTGVIKNDGWEQIVDFKDNFAVDKLNPRIEVELIEQTS